MAANSTRFFKKEPKIENLNQYDVSDEQEEGEITGDENEELAPLAETETLLEDAAEAASSDAAKRFALIGDHSLAVPKEELAELYASLGIDEETERHYRFNTVHMRGLAKMSTKDIHDYFSGLEPAKVDWLDKGVCNVEWEDEILPARALLYLSVEIRNLEKKLKREAGIIDSDDEGEEVVITGKSVDAYELNFPIPPGHWRKGVAYEISKNIIMRYANKDDKKIIERNDRHYSKHQSRHKRSKHKEIVVDDTPNNPWGSLAQTWGRGEGVENYFTPAMSQNCTAADLRTSLNHEKTIRFADQYLERAVIQSRVRRFNVTKGFVSSDSDSDSSSPENDEYFIRKRKLPRMHADREEEKQKMARLEAASRPKDLRARLNLRKAVLARQDPRRLNTHSEDSGDLSSDWAVEGYSDLKRTLRTEPRPSNSELSEESDLELSDDEPGELLQIEIDNDRCKSRRRRDN